MPMAEPNALKYLFSEHIYFLSQKAVGHLLDHCDICGFYKIRKWMTDILSMKGSELLLRINREGDEEDDVPLINVFLWKQREGLIEKRLRLHYTFDEQFRAWLPHRYMVANGYPDIERLPVEIGGKVTTYERAVNDLLDLFEQTWEARDYNDADLLAVCLNVIGPKIGQHPRLEAIRSFAEFLMTHYCSDEKLTWLPASYFTMLVYDLKIDIERSWPAYCFLLNTEQNREWLENIPAWLLGLRMYGERAAKEIEQVSTLLSIELLKSLA